MKAKLITAFVLACVSSAAMAQEAATVTGRVTNAQGQPEAAVIVRIESLNAEASTASDGSYRLVIPGSRIRAGQQVTIATRRAGLAPIRSTITLRPGANISRNFQLRAQRTR